MNIKKSSCILLFLLVFQSVFSQEIAIPYRDGNLWGICNEEGKILIEPKFDKLEFEGSSSSYNAHDLITTYKNGLKGFLINGKELLEPKYTSIYAYEGLIKTSSNENGSTHDVISFKGISIFKNPVAYIISSGRIVGKYELYHVMHHNLTESIFVFDSSTHTFVQTLYENFYSVAKNGKQVHPQQFSFLVKKSKNDGLSTETWDFSKIPFEKTKHKNTVDDERYFTETFIYKANKLKNESNNYGSSGKGNSYGTGSSNGDEMVVEAVDSYEERMGYDVAIPEPDVPGRNETKSISINYSFKVENEKIILQKTTSSTNEKPTFETISTNFSSKEIQLKSYHSSNKESDITTSYNNYLIHKKGNKSAVIFAENMDNIVYFDTITSIVRSVYEANYKLKETVFVVGNKDKFNNIKFGLYSNVRNLISELIYDEIKQTILPSHNQNSTFQTKIGSKIGFIQADGTVHSLPKYDEVKEIYSSKNNYEKMLQTKKGNQYGLIFSNGNSNVFMDVFSPFQIQDIIKNYPEQSRDILPEQQVKKRTMLISLKDDYGKFVGYANIKGQLFFKN